MDDRPAPVGGHPPFDPSFVIRATAASVEASFLPAFVLINQNRMTAGADRRADLDLHASLLAGHEINGARSAQAGGNASAADPAELARTIRMPLRQQGAEAVKQMVDVFGE